MAFGYKVNKIAFANEYKVEDLFEKIKDQTFQAGKPEVISYMGSTIIVFPALNSKNQVQIMTTSLGNKKPTKKYVIQKGDELNVSGAAKNLVLNSLTGGYSNLRNTFGDAPKECMRLVDTTFEELTALGL
ncbi:MAG: hypothetical protein R3Y06_11490 [Faecalibacterium sp.]